jgi:hypothetical protein
MNNHRNDKLTKSLALIGTLLVWFPILAPIILTMIFLFKSGIFRFDYLMPAELFLFALVGGIMLAWAAYRAGVRFKLIAWSLGIATGMLIGTQGLAVITGLASGETKPEGLPLVLVMTIFTLFLVMLVVTGISGLLLVRDLIRGEP